MRYILIAITLMGSSLSAEQVENTDGEHYLDTTRSLTGDRSKSASKGKVIEDRVGGQFDDYLDTVVWNDSYTRKTNDISYKQVHKEASNKITLDNPASQARDAWAIAEAEQRKLQTENQKSEIPSVFAGGYCTLYNTLEISKSNEYSKLDCLLDFGEGSYQKVELFSAFYPDYKREMIIAIPMYVTFEDQTRATFSGITLNANQTSINIASWSDSRRIQKLLGEGLLVINNTIFKYTTGYMQALQASRVHENIEYITTKGIFGQDIVTPVSRTTVEPPEIKDYMITAGVELLSNIFAISGKEYLYSQEPLFRVAPQKVYVEGVISYDNKGLAKRFGTIANQEVSKAMKNNNNWQQRKESTIQKYNGKYKAPLPAGGQ